MALMIGAAVNTQTDRHTHTNRDRHTHTHTHTEVGYQLFCLLSVLPSPCTCLTADLINLYTKLLPNISQATTQLLKRSSHEVLTTRPTCICVCMCVCVRRGRHRQRVSSGRRSAERMVQFTIKRSSRLAFRLDEKRAN